MSQIKLLKISFITLLAICLVVASNKNHSITKRSLLFPRATVLQITYGISVPAILPSRTIILSLCFQVNYDLPYNLTRLLQPKIIQARQDDGFDLSREKFYQYLIDFLNSLGLDGEDCLLRLICEISEFPMHLDHKENLLEKITHFMFTPSLEVSSNSSSYFYEDLIKAEKYGQQKKNCQRIYRNCFISIADLFTSRFIS